MVELGWEWALPFVMVCLPLYRERKALLPILAAIAPGLFWLALFLATGDRRLYFCYSMQFAVQLACRWRARSLRASFAGGSIVIAAFLTVRIAQGATASVLFLELAVAAAVLCISIVLHGPCPHTAARRAAVAALASLLAFAGLAL